MRNWLIISAKIIISAGVIFAIGRRFEVAQLVLSLRQANILYLIIAVAVAFIAVPVVGHRWRLLAGMLLVNISTAVAIRATFAGLFVGQILPGAIGSDVVRGWMVWRMGLRNKLVIASLVADRIASLFAVALMIVASLPILIPYLPQRIAVWIQWGLIALVVLAPVTLLFFRGFRLARADQAINQLMCKLRIESIRLSSRVVLRSLGLAVLGHALMILSAYFLSLAIGVDTSLWMWCMIMPIIILITAIPVSINGWGIREFVMIHLWALFGVGQSDAFLVSICVGVVAIVSSLPGLWFWLERRHQTHIEAPRSDVSMEPYKELS